MYIDCFPFILDYKLCKTEQDYEECLRALAGTKSGVLLYKIKQENQDKILRSIENKSIDSFIISSKDVKQIQDALDKLGMNQYSHVQYFTSLLTRCLLDTLYRGTVKQEILDILINNIDVKKAAFDKIEYIYSYAKIAHTKICDYIFENNLHHTQLERQYVNDRFINYMQLGSSAWIPKNTITEYNKSNSIKDNSIQMHGKFNGVIKLASKTRLNTHFNLSELLNEKVSAAISEEIMENPLKARELTMKGNWCAIITNGTAILGLGDIGATTGLPVMEGKSCIFKALADVDVIPICIQEKNVDKLVSISRKLLPIFSAINLEDIKAPECFDVEKKLIEQSNIAIFHDDQHGTAIVACAGLINALKLMKKKPQDVKVVINGGGAAGISCTELMQKIGISNIIMCDTTGTIYEGRTKNMNKQKEIVAKLTNKDKVQGNLKDALKDADIFIGVSAKDALKPEWIKTMKPNPLILALANPEPEIYPDVALKAGAFIVGTGRSDFQNQINNSLAFPGIFRGLLDARAHKVTIEMKLAAAKAIANCVEDKDLRPDYIIPAALNPYVSVYVAAAVVKTAMDQGIAQEHLDIDQYIKKTIKRLQPRNLNIDSYEIKK